MCSTLVEIVIERISFDSLLNLGDWWDDEPQRYTEQSRLDGTDGSAAIFDEDELQPM